MRTPSLPPRPNDAVRGILVAAVLVGLVGGVGSLAVAHARLFFGTSFDHSASSRQIPDQRSAEERGALPRISASGAQNGAILFSTYLGGSGTEIPVAVAFDESGNIYVAGSTSSPDFPTRNPLFGYRGGPLIGMDAYVAKLSPDGDSLLFATHIGGTGEEIVTDLLVGPDGAIWLAGGTSSDDFPLRDPLQEFRSGSLLRSDGFLVRLAPDGAEMTFSSYIGGTGDESVTGIALDTAGAIYVTGSTLSADFPVSVGAFQTQRPGEGATSTEMFVAKLRPRELSNGYAYAYVTYVGGTGDEIPTDIQVDERGRAWITGFTNSFDYPLQWAFQTQYGGPLRETDGDAFVTCVNSEGSGLDFSTYLGGTQSDQGTALALFGSGAVLVSGTTRSPDFPVGGAAWQPARRGIQNRFLSQIIQVSDQDWRLGYSTYLGSTAWDAGTTGLAIARSKDVWVGGSTTGGDFPIADPQQAVSGGGEVEGFIARLDAEGSSLGYATYLGGGGADLISGLALGETRLCVTGATGSDDFPVMQPLQAGFDGPPQVGLGTTSTFVTCYTVENAAPELTSVRVTPDSVGLVAGQHVQFTAAGLDQYGHVIDASITWSATGGSIDSAGVFTAGPDVGLFSVAARDTAAGLAAEAVVNIYSGVGLEEASDLPIEFALYPNYPNPFNPRTVIRFDVKEPARVLLTVFDAMGRRRALLADQPYPHGRHEIVFDGQGLASGVYFFQIEMGRFTDVRQMVLVK